MSTRNTREVVFKDFSGGRASAKNPTGLQLNEALDLDNVVILPQGAGLRSRRGNTAFNASAMIGATSDVHGLDFFKDTSANEWLVAVTDDKIFKSDSLDGTMDDITDTVTITTGQDNRWQLIEFNDLIIGVGGAPDAPWKWTGSGNAADLGGSPISGSFGFAYNNRMFIGGDTTNPSRVRWSVLKDPEDWSGAGSGFTDINLDDGSPLIGAAPLNNNVVLLFKENTVHQLVGRTSPFSTFPLFADLGLVGKDAVVVADGLAYFITPQARMVVTDGSTVIDNRNLPRLNSIDDVWNGLNSARLKYIKGIRYTGSDFDWIIWLAANTTSGTQNYAIVWDLVNKCWLTCSTGFEGNILAKIPAGTLYMGGYDGTIYKMDVASTFTDASNSSTPVNWFWRSDWLTSDNLQSIAQVNRLNLAYKTQVTGNIMISYGFDFTKDGRTKAFPMQTDEATWDQGIWDVDQWGGQTDKIKPLFTLGRGNTFNFKIQGMDNIEYNVNRFSLVGKIQSFKHFEAS